MFASGLFAAFLICQGYVNAAPKDAGKTKEGKSQVSPAAFSYDGRGRKLVKDDPALSSDLSIQFEKRMDTILEVSPSSVVVQRSYRFKVSNLGPSRVAKFIINVYDGVNKSTQYIAPSSLSGFILGGNYDNGPAWEYSGELNSGQQLELGFQKELPLSIKDLAWTHISKVQISSKQNDPNSSNNLAIVK